MSMRIGILGSRGIPNQYGGFERFAEQFSMGLVSRGYEVFVYNSHNHVNQEKKWNDVHIIHCYDPEYLLGSSGQFIYDLNCIFDSRKRKFDVILMLGYTSSSLWGWLFPENSVIIYNMDGIEWKRAKYSKMTRQFLEYAERWAVKSGDFHVADSPILKSYFDNKYGLNSEYIAYGATIFPEETLKLADEYGIRKYEYYLLLARMEPENNIEIILDGFSRSKSEKKFLVVGNIANRFGKHLNSKFRHDQRIIFTGGIYDEQRIHTLRSNAQLYFHGHSTGGTNPSLLEAMASKTFVVAHDNIFNRAVLKDNALYFNSPDDIRYYVENIKREELDESMLKNNLERIKAEYDWQDIISKYERFMIECVYNHSHARNILSKRLSW
jgi:glycosyltransferase involved in cell wall biosynthesis